MTKKQLETESQDVMLVLESTCKTSGERSAAILDFVRKRGLENSVVICPDESEHSAVKYAMQLYCNADRLATEGDDAQESYQISALLCAAERVRTDHWGYGSKLNYDLRSAGIKLRRDPAFNEVGAFMAQKGTWKSNPYDKGKNMERNLLAVALYASDLISRCGSMVGTYMLPANEPDAAITEQFAKCLSMETPTAICEQLITIFVPAYLGQDGEQLAATLCGFLRSNDYYWAPASTKYHGALWQGLVTHSIGVTCRLFELLKPTTAAKVGKIVLCGLFHDLCKTSFYKSAWRNRKVYSEGGSKSDPDGKTFDWVPNLEFEIEDTMPFGHGGKSAYMLNGVMNGKLPEEVACAIVGHMNDDGENPEIEQMYMEQPLAMLLHIADTLESQIDAPIYEAWAKNRFNMEGIKTYPWRWKEAMQNIYKSVYMNWGYTE